MSLCEQCSMQTRGQQAACSPWSASLIPIVRNNVWHLIVMSFVEHSGDYFSSYPMCWRKEKKNTESWKRAHYVSTKLYKKCPSRSYHKLRVKTSVQALFVYCVKQKCELHCANKHRSKCICKRCWCMQFCCKDDVMGLRRNTAKDY